MNMYVCPFFIFESLCSWAKLGVALISARFRTYVMFKWKSMLDSCCWLLDEHLCVFVFVFWKFSWKTRIEDEHCCCCPENPNNFPETWLFTCAWWLSTVPFHNSQSEHLVLTPYARSFWLVDSKITTMPLGPFKFNIISF